MYGSGEAYVYSVQSGSFESSSFASPNQFTSGLFGFGVAVSGSQVIVGAPGEASQLGHAYVFRNPSYALVAGSSPLAYSNFGSSVAASGHMVAIGAPGWNGDDGAVWVLNTATNKEYRLTAPGGITGAEFGLSVAVSGSTLAVGAPAYNGTLGAVFLFNVGTGAFLGSVAVPTAIANATPLFGYSVALSGTHLVVGAPGAHNLTGMALVCSTSTETCPTEFAPMANGSYSLVGYSVAVNGTTAVIGAPAANTTSGPFHPFEGAAWEVDFSGSLVVTNLSVPTPGNTDLFGLSVSIDAGQIAVGTPGLNVSGTNVSGAVYLYNRTTAALTMTFYSPNPGQSGRFGTAVAISGVSLVVGAPEENSTSAAYGFVLDAGDAYVFNAQTGALTYVFADPNAQTGGQLGAAVAVSGSTAVIGAPYEMEFGATWTGSAYIL